VAALPRAEARKPVVQGQLADLRAEGELVVAPIAFGWQVPAVAGSGWRASSLPALFGG